MLVATLHEICFELLNASVQRAVRRTSRMRLSFGYEFPKMDARLNGTEVLDEESTDEALMSIG